jgi:signal recognition particle receptor subunit beta
MAYLAYIVDTNAGLAEQISQKLKEFDLQTKVFEDFSGLLKSSAEQSPDIVVLNVSLYNDKELYQQFYLKTPTIVYASQMPPDEILDLYYQNIKRVVIEAGDLPGHLAAVVNMVLYRRNQLRRLRQESITHGSIKFTSLREVLQNAMMEKKNLVLKVRHKGWEAKIRVYEGHVVSAESSNVNNEEAVLKMLNLKNGSFVIRGYQKPEENSAISSSNVALLAEARFQQNAIQEFLNEFGVGMDNPKFRVIHSNEILELPSDKLKVLDLVEEYAMFQDVLSYSPFSLAKTIQTLAEFASRGLISPEKPEKAENFDSFQPQDIEYIREKLFREGASSGTLVILGAPGGGKTELIRTLAGFQKGSMKTVQSLDFVRVNLQSNIKLTILGVSTDETFLPILEKISRAMVACVLLIDYSQQQQYEFLKYLLNQVIRFYEVPTVIGLTNVNGGGDFSLQEFRRQFVPPHGVEVFPVETNSFEDARQLLYHLRKSPAETGEGKAYA